MVKKRVLITGVGGNVGQGIIRNIRRSFPDFYIIGVNVDYFSAGNHLCDSFYVVPFAYQESYIQTILNICLTEKVQLIIPSTDYEVYYLSLNKDLFKIKIAVSGKHSAETYLDKYLTYLHHRSCSIPFAETYLPSQYKGQFQEHIAKPRKGRGSRGLLINPRSWDSLSDEEYVIQKLFRGSEITTAFYVNKNRQLHGLITLLRYLENGTTTKCKVIFDFDQTITPIIELVIKYSDICGSANMQSIVSEDGSIHPFELNCRISGTNSIRSNFGFDDVKYTIQEFLLDQPLSEPSVIPGVAVRILMDVIYPNQLDFKKCRDRNIFYYLF